MPYKILNRLLNLNLDIKWGRDPRNNTKMSGNSFKSDVKIAK
jgi:hypothetical protein